MSEPGADHGQSPENPSATARDPASTTTVALSGARIPGAGLLAGEVALVTGASRGIGAAIARALAEQGALVVGTATSEAGAQRISDTLPRPSYGAPLDVNDAAACEALVARILKDHQKLSVLINNAGITRDNLAMRMKDSDWLEVISTNLTSVFRLSRLAIRPMMKSRHGRIINITSVVASSGNPGQSNYAAAKAGVAGMSRALAREIGSRGITVNCVAPGFIDTDMTRALAPEQIAALTQQIPLGRLGQADDIAAACVFLASPGAGYITGVTLPVNGGMHMT
jgi:3-oxoacyl-[acyl-carrier protein] reductase